MLAVIGGGRFGSFHVRQLLKAVRSGRLPGERLLVVDRSPSCQAFAEFEGAPEVRRVVSDWLEFLSGWLPGAARSDRLIPAPLAPHLLWDWLAGELPTARLDTPRGWGLPYEQPGARGALFLSAAGWTCPATCVEPAHCPALHAPRDWDLADLITARALEWGYQPAVFRLRHVANGVGGIAAGELLEARAGLAGLAEQAPVLVATSSHCHAAVGTLRTGAAR
jgi:hypothetical protein